MMFSKRHPWSLSSGWPNNQKCLQILQNILWGGKMPWVENHWFTRATRRCYLPVDLHDFFSNHSTYFARPSSGSPWNPWNSGVGPLWATYNKGIWEWERGTEEEILVGVKTCSSCDLPEVQPQASALSDKRAAACQEKAFQQRAQVCIQDQRPEQSI